MNVLIRLQATVLLCALIVGISADAVRCEEKEKILVTLGKETTVISEPLRKSGYPDYLEALNKHQSAGVTPENNIVVAIVKMTGPAKIKPEIATEYFKRLGIAPLPTDGKYLQTYEDYVKALPDEKLPKPNKTESEIKDADIRNGTIRERLVMEEEKLTEPWTAQEYPIAAEWLKAQEPLLALLNDYEKRTKYYSPFVDEHEDQRLLETFSRVEITIVRELFVTRIMFSLGKSDRATAWSDVKKLTYFVKCFRHSSTAIEQMQGYWSFRCITDRVLTFFAQDQKISLKELEEIQREFDAIPPMNVASAINMGERYIYLDAIRDYAEKGFETASLMDGKKEKLTRTIPYDERKKFNYDLMLKEGNLAIDEFVKIASVSDWEQRQKLFNENEIADMELRKALLNPVSKFAAFASPESISKRISDVQKVMAASSYRIVVRMQLHEKAYRDMQNAGLTLARYHKKKGKYPTDFAELKSEGIERKPYDSYNGCDWTYQCDGTGFILYTTFMDGFDSGGFNDGKGTLGEHDDIATFSLNRIPKPPKMKKELPRPK